MKKIGLFLSAEPHSGGKFQYILSILDAVIELPVPEFSVVIAYSSSEWVSYLSKESPKKLHTPFGPWKWLFDRIWKNSPLPVSLWRKCCPSFMTLARVLLRERCDLWIFPAEESFAYQLPLQTLGTVFDLMHRYEPNFPEVSAWGRGRRRDRHYRNMCRWARGLLVDSAKGKEQLIDSYGVEEGRVHILPYVALRYLVEIAAEKNDNLDGRLPPKYLFYPAQFWEHKNHKNLLLAVKMLKAKLPDLKLVLVGTKKNAFNSVLKQIRQLRLENDVLFLGYVSNSDIAELYRRARGLIMPTFFGPTNIPPLEAFQVGCPVACSNVYAMPEQVGEAALLFDPNSVEGIADSVYKLWIDDDLCAKLVEKGKEKSRQWGQRQFNNKFQDIITTTLAQNPDHGKRPC